MDLYDLQTREMAGPEPSFDPVMRDFLANCAEELRLRQERGSLADRDYRVLIDPRQVEDHRLAFLEAQETLQSDALLAQEQYLEICFGDRRLTYRMGCELIRRIERAYGMDAVREGFYMSGEEWVRKYRGLIE